MLLSVEIADVAATVDTLWALLGVVLIFFMQAGFAMCETGFTRAKNAGNIIMKNLMDFCLGSIVFWLLGYGLMHGQDLGGVIGKVINPLSLSIDFKHFMFNLVFAATAATIVSGAMAERTKFSAYCIYSIIISALIYPISGHWIWGGGWLSNLGFVDFAGSTAVHMVGGVAALVGAKILGPRIGKYSKDETGKLVVKAIPGHSLTLGALGVFILWFCWYGFNGSSTYIFDLASYFIASRVFVTTTIAAATSTTAVMCITWVKYHKPDVSMTLNGSLAGLVAITAGCAVVSPVGAFFIGLAAGFLLVYGVEFIDKKLKIDDPVGAISVHGLCGAMGTILVGVFSMDYGVISGFIYNKSLTAEKAFGFLGVQALGVLSVALWVVVCMVIVFQVIKKTIGLRVSQSDEIVGLDISEHGLVSSYADFMPTTPAVFSPKVSDKIATDKVVPIDEAVKVVNKASSCKMSKVVIIASPTKFDALKNKMDSIGITGMTLTQVSGCGMQKGYSSEYYRGVKVDVHLLPKIKLELVVTKVPIDTVITAAKEALYSGAYGDGKIFVYDVERVVKIRTGEEDYLALQDEE